MRRSVFFPRPTRQRGALTDPHPLPHYFPFVHASCREKAAEIRAVSATTTAMPSRTTLAVQGLYLWGPWVLRSTAVVSLNSYTPHHHTHNTFFFLSQRAKADADAEKQIALVNAKEKLAEEYDRKEKLLAVDLKMCVRRASHTPLLHATYCVAF